MAMRLAQFLPLLAMLCWAAAQDWRTRRIANMLTIPLLAAGVGRAILVGGAAPEQCALGIGVGFGLTLIPFLMHALGGGDVKLLAAAGAWLGPGATLSVFVVAAIIGMFIVLTQAIIQRRLPVLLRNTALLTLAIVHVDQLGVQHIIETGNSSSSVRKPLPYAVPVLLATLLLLAVGIPI